MKKPWYRQKTVWTGIGGVVTGGIMIYTGELKEGVGLIFASLQMIFLRQGVESNKSD